MNYAALAGMAFTLVVFLAGLGVGASIEREPIITHTTDAELAMCIVNMDAYEDWQGDIETWLHNMRGVWILTTEVPE